MSKGDVVVVVGVYIEVDIYYILVSKPSRKDDAMLTWVGASREGFTILPIFCNRAVAWIGFCIKLRSTEKIKKKQSLLI